MSCRSHLSWIRFKELILVNTIFMIVNVLKQIETDMQNLK
jgi:hypothetical protein